jgi:hypothetical protein
MVLAGGLSSRVVVAVCAAVVGCGVNVSYLHRYQNDAVLRVEVCKSCALVYFGVTTQA